MRQRRSAISQGIAESGYRLIINQGDEGGQEVPHLHMHVLGGKRLRRPGNRVGGGVITLPRRVAERTAALPDELVAHLVRVRKLARKLAKRHGVDRDASELGAACHDLARHMSPRRLDG